MTTNSSQKEALVIGSSISGLQATLDLADSGISTHLIESDPFLRKNIENTIPAHMLRRRILEITRHPNVTLWTNTEINHWVSGNSRGGFQMWGYRACSAGPIPPHLTLATANPGEPNHYEKNGCGFKVELKQQPRYVDINSCTACGECIEVCPVTVPGSEHKVIYLDGQPGCMTIDKGGKPPCSNTCPGGIPVQGYIALIAQGRFQEAIDLIREAIPFPGICGRVCTHPCEINCRRSEIDAPVSVRLLKRFVSDWEREHYDSNQFKLDFDREQSTARVAIVGAGPGGMAVADRLARKGYGVTVFDKLPVIGGMLAVGIPSYRLPREVIAREYQQIQDLGVEIKLNTTIGPEGDYSLDDLFEMGYEAICLAVGAHKSQSLNIPGEDLPGVVHGIDVLKTISLIHQHDDVKNEIDLLQVLRRGTKTRVAVLGGGNTAIDAARSLKRYNVENVNIIYRRTRAEMPAMPEEIEDAEVEGVELGFLISPVRVLGDEANGVTGLECLRMQLGKPDSSGRRRPVPIEGSEFVIDLDLVVLAIGQKPDLNFLDPDHGITITKNQRIDVANPSFMTSCPGVFAVGDVVTQNDMVVIEAIGMGKQAAVAIDAFLRGQNPLETIPNEQEALISYRELSASECEQKLRLAVPGISIDKRTSSFAEVELGFSAEQAIAEAQRCLACGPCSECQACVQVCKPGAIIHNQQEAVIHLDVGAMIYADQFSDDGLKAFSDPDADKIKGIHYIPQDDALHGSVVAHRAFLDLYPSERRMNALEQIRLDDLSVGHPSWGTSHAPEYSNQPDRTGVFTCQCGPEGQGQISRVIDTQSICSQAATWPGVIHAQTLPISCSLEGAKQIDEAVETHQLNRIVLASCSCCSIDQVCYSCTYQRIRCKKNLHLFTQPERSSALGTIDQATKFVLVNIREQCAWVHADDPEVATSKAAALIAGSVARAMATPTKFNGTKKAARSALILGHGAAGKDCVPALNDCGIDASLVDILPEAIRHAGSKYIVSQKNDTWQAPVLVLAPQDAAETERLFDAFKKNGSCPRIHAGWGGLDTHRPGVYFIDPDLDASIAGAATAGRVAAWLSRVENQHTITSVVNSARCRACGTCVEICEFGAPILIEDHDEHRSWIDPLMCNGCGTCVAHCPSGAIMAGYSTDAQIEAMLSAMLARPI
jgi:NADPH-dependent glutamate synthase beta subunit-like oxidoreductase/NAD-dependent dihydropyrimidine dehydrogenase PreA subunit